MLERIKKTSAIDVQKIAQTCAQTIDYVCVLDKHNWLKKKMKRK